MARELRRVVVTGLGAITPLGVGTSNTWSRLVAGQSGIISTSLLATSSKSSSHPAFRSTYPESRWSELPSQVVGMVPLGPKSGGGWNIDEWLEKVEQRRMARFSQFAVVAAGMALEDAALGEGMLSEETRERAGVVLGSGIGNLDELYESAVGFEKGGYRTTSPLFVPKMLINLAAGHISMKYGLQGPNHAPSTACTTGAHSIIDAANLIRLGSAPLMLAGAAESCLHPLAFAGFSRSRSLATDFNDFPEEASRPFDEKRDGFVMGEGAGVIVLEDLEHALARNAPIYAELLSSASSADAHHMTRPPPSGHGAYLAMKRALQNARISPFQVDYVNAHATGTMIGDEAENKALERLFSEDVDAKARKRGEICVSSTKGAIGHALGAAGAVEAVFAVLAVKENIVPPTLNLHHPSPGFEFNFVPHTAQEREVNIAISNSFGFGGTNATLVFGKWKG